FHQCQCQAKGQPSTQSPARNEDSDTRHAGSRCTSRPPALGVHEPVPTMQFSSQLKCPLNAIAWPKPCVCTMFDSGTMEQRKFACLCALVTAELRCFSRQLDTPPHGG